MTRGFIAFTALLIIASAGAAVYRSSRLPAPGLRAAVFASADFTTDPVLVEADRTLSVADLARRAGRPLDDAFGVEWRGSLLAERAGDYWYRMTADDGAAVWVDERPVVEAIGAPGVHERRGVFTLERGVHAVRIRYVQYLGGAAFDFTWAGPENRESFAAPDYFQPVTPTPAFIDVMVARRLPLVVALGWCAWVAWVLAAGFARIVAPRGLWRRAPASSGRAVPVALAVSAILMVTAIHWGLPPWRGWHPEEIAPEDVMVAIERGFAGGWSHFYPPLHFLLSALVLSPLVLADRLGLAALSEPLVIEAFQIGMRLLSLAMALLTLRVAHLIGYETIGGRRSALAVLIAGTTQLTAYYGKTANVDVPCALWVTTAIWFFVRAARRRLVADHAWLGVTAACAIATKDQAVGFFAGPALVLLALAWRAQHGRGLLRQIAGTLGDVRLLAGLAACALTALCAFGVPWNYQGFLTHLETVTGWRAQAFRMFEASAMGQVQLFGATLRVLPWALGVVPLALAAAGAIVAVRRARRFNGLWLATVPIVSYYVTLVMAVGYVYDRFLIVPAIIASLFAALGADWLWRAIPRPAVRHVVAAACAVAIVLPAVWLDGEMIHGSRDRLEAWLAARRGSPLVLAVGNRLYLPNLYPYRQLVMNSAEEDIDEWGADVIVINEDWVRRSVMTRARLHEVLRAASYDVAYADAPRRPALIALLTGWPADSSASNLLKVSPPFTAYVRRAPSP